MKSFFSNGFSRFDKETYNREDFELALCAVDSETEARVKGYGEVGFLEFTNAEGNKNYLSFYDRSGSTVPLYIFDENGINNTVNDVWLGMRQKSKSIFVSVVLDHSTEQISVKQFDSEKLAEEAYLRWGTRVLSKLELKVPLNSGTPTEYTKIDLTN